MKQRSEVQDKLEVMLAEAKAAGHAVKKLFSDNGGEFDSEKVRDILNRNGVRQRSTMSYTPQQNVCAEWDNRTVVETAKALMHARKGLPKYLWAEMVNTATYILNRSGFSSIDGKSPYEIWHMNTIGSTWYAHISKSCRKKMDRKAENGILIVYDNDDGYGIWSEETRKLIRSRNVAFDENLLSNVKLNETPVSPSHIEDYISDSSAENMRISGNSTKFNDDEEVGFEDKDISGSTELRDRSEIKIPPNLMILL